MLADGQRLVVKRLTGEDWVSRITHDTGREVGLWEQGVLARMPPEIDPAVLDAGRDGRAGWLLMRDVSGELLPADRRLSRAESTTHSGGGCGAPPAIRRRVDLGSLLARGSHHAHRAGNRRQRGKRGRLPAEDARRRLGGLR